MNKMREEFEKWYQYYYGADKLTWIDGVDDYDFTSTSMMWKAWQASRTALVVDMTVHEEFDKRMYASNVYKELDKAGIKYE